MEIRELNDVIVADIIAAYLGKKPDKHEPIPLIMILMDYVSDDHAEDHMTMSEFWDDGMRKRSMLQDLIDKWKKGGK